MNRVNMWPGQSTLLEQFIKKHISSLTISELEFNFIVHEPKGIIDLANEMSFLLMFLMNLSI